MFYDNATFIPKQIIIEEDEDKDIIEDWLHQKRCKGEYVILNVGKTACRDGCRKRKNYEQWKNKIKLN